MTTLVTVSLLCIFLLAFYPSMSSLLLLQYLGQFHIFLEALLCMSPVFVPVEVPLRARDRGTEVKARFISVYTLNHQGGQLSFRVIWTKKLVRSNCPFLDSLDTCSLMSSYLFLDISSICFSNWWFNFTVHMGLNGCLIPEYVWLFRSILVDSGFFGLNSSD